MQKISEQLNLGRFVFRHPTSLFDLPILEALKLGRCPHNHKLYPMLTKPYYICKAKTCPIYLQTRKRFIVGKEKVDKYKIK